MKMKRGTAMCCIETRRKITEFRNSKLAFFSGMKYRNMWQFLQHLAVCVSWGAGTWFGLLSTWGWMSSEATVGYTICDGCISMIAS